MGIYISNKRTNFRLKESSTLSNGTVRRPWKVLDTGRALLNTHVPDDWVSKHTPKLIATRSTSRNTSEIVDALLFTEKEVARVVGSHKYGRAPETDLIKICVLKKAFAVVPTHFVDHFNGCLRRGIFPSIWKKGSLRALLMVKKR